MKKTDSRISDPSKWQGLNLLGKALTNLRYDFTIELQNKSLLESKKEKDEESYSLESVFNQSHPSLFTVNNVGFTSVNQFVSYCKAKLFKDNDTAEDIIYLNSQVIDDVDEGDNLMESRNGVLCSFLNSEITKEDILKTQQSAEEWLDFQSKIKKLDSEVIGFDEKVWEGKESSYIAKGNFEKFTQNKDLKSILLSSEDNDSMPSLFEVKDVKFTSIDQFMTYCKAKLFKDEETANKIILINEKENHLRDEDGKILDERFEVMGTFINGDVSKAEILSHENIKKEWDDFQSQIDVLDDNVSGFIQDVWNKNAHKFRIKGNEAKYEQNPELKTNSLNNDDTILNRVLAEVVVKINSPVVDKSKKKRSANRM